MPQTLYDLLRLYLVCFSSTDAITVGVSSHGLDNVVAERFVLGEDVT